MREHPAHCFSPFHPVSTITAVVPALNEAAMIRNCITSILQQPDIKEIIVADGGSEDKTAEISGESGAKIVHCRRVGRGVQILEGIQQASGDVILIVHADCQLITGAAGQLIQSLNRNPFLAGGAFNMAFASPDFRQQTISCLNNLRSKVTGISFGDQGQFVRKEALDRIGGFPEQMLMEDVELSLRLKAVGKLIFLPKGIIVSGRRWETQPFVKGVGRVLYLFFRYLIERRTGKIKQEAKDYHTRYYRG